MTLFPSKKLIKIKLPNISGAFFNIWSKLILTKLELYGAPKVKYILFFLFLSFTTALFAQGEDSPTIHSNEYGIGLTVAMSGMGIGGYYRFALPGFTYLGASLDIYSMRDEKEFSYYLPGTSIPVQVNKYNRLFIIPIGLEFKKRFFQNSIEDGFRPYAIAMTGVTFGMNFPRDNGDEYRATINFAIGVGIDINTKNNVFVSIRPQYRVIYFTKSIAGKENHSNFEIRIEIGGRKIKR